MQVRALAQSWQLDSQAEGWQQILGVQFSSRGGLLLLTEGPLVMQRLTGPDYVLAHPSKSDPQGPQALSQYAEWSPCGDKCCTVQATQKGPQLCAYSAYSAFTGTPPTRPRLPQPASPCCLGCTAACPACAGSCCSADLRCLLVKLDPTTADRWVLWLLSEPQMHGCPMGHDLLVVRRRPAVQSGNQHPRPCLLGHLLAHPPGRQVLRQPRWEAPGCAGQGPLAAHPERTDGGRAAAAGQ